MDGILADDEDNDQDKGDDIDEGRVSGEEEVKTFHTPPGRASGRTHTTSGRASTGRAHTTSGHASTGRTHTTSGRNPTGRIPPGRTPTGALLLVALLWAIRWRVNRWSLMASHTDVHNIARHDIRREESMS